MLLQVLTKPILGVVVDKFLCPRCRGHGCDDKQDTSFEDVDVNCAPGSCRMRGRVGDVEGNGFSGILVLRHGKVHHFQRGPEGGQTLL